jgi:hypothetical protein
MTAAPLAQQILALLPKLCAYSATRTFVRFLVGSTNYACRHRGLANSAICFYLLRQRRDLISSPLQDGFAEANLGHRPGIRLNHHSALKARFSVQSQTYRSSKSMPCLRSNSRYSS